MERYPYNPMSEKPKTETSNSKSHGSDKKKGGLEETEPYASDPRVQWVLNEARKRRERFRQEHGRDYTSEDFKEALIRPSQFTPRESRREQTGSHRRDWFHNNRDETPYTPTLEELMPGGLSRAGFLKEGQTLEQVLERDRKAMEILGYTSKELADLLESVFKKVYGPNNRIAYTAPNGKIYDIELRVHRGYQECPWEKEQYGRGTRSFMEISVTQKGKEDKPILIGGLLPHLIGEHSFFEGGTYRIAPEKIVELFGEERKSGSIEKATQLTL